MRFSILAITFIGCLFTATAQDRSHYTDLFETANEAYKQKDYEKAQGLYKQILEGGLVSADLYYNLGNSFYKMGRLPEAILYYERGLKLRPMDQDIQFNLEIARASAVDKIEPIPALFWKTWWNGFSRMMSLNGWTVLFFIFLCTAVLLTGVFILGRDARTRKLSFMFLVTFFALAGLSMACMLSQYHQLYEEQKAIVFAPSLHVKSEPGLSSTDLFVIHEGTKVWVDSEEGEWVRISLSDGKSGWVEAAAIEQI